ncbi:hypothetical protein PHYBLDRAFT_178344 [Phycomyces blakesleeanus NRRL 1555(-)]|uniref:U3 small nucleolar RNA-associated protein 13 C-terminal domain-containing protein n=1 Tax=Phycomyces blakesleeanus (strain ATCC 8743b / DSM 1359 / FGSC 10004 / NBRC 33097 / NRRL 1555) TaxID=763407 RepID=A0A167K5F2_PHYB8|nr:hypothetical protein PHYBLDRAFT_178344 [Phycomyces blakesleeanus NRRL 1555(-)]OAD67317.1 hypothetical protein PHYBLDRAFT_178344 [Phycomyces blakesleeanus NRRL 1555(-)]|eukprot:XP_018285357.1 hypothetical protein PHYBLDRAFT_178344 [Phycomyces blakesleeanus NRRL 1555(-)]
MEDNSRNLMLKTSFKSVKTIESIYTGGKVDVTEDESTLITTINEDIDVTEMATGKKLHRLSGDTEIVTTLAVKPDGKHLVSASRSLNMRIWDMATGECIRTLKAHEAPIIVMDIDQSSTLVATGSADATVKVWDIDRGFCTHNFKGHGGVVSAVKFHHYHGKWYLASGADDCQVRIWDLQTRKCIAVLQSHVSVIRGLSFSNDGETLISGSRDKVVNVWDWKKKVLKATFPIYETQELAAVTNDQNILFYSIINGLERVKQVVGYNDEIVDIAYLGSDEKYLAAATNSEQLRVYNVETQNCDLVYGHKDMIICIDRSNDGNVLVTGSKDKTARVWRIDVDAEHTSQKYVCAGVCVGHTESVGAIAFARKSTNFMITGSQDRTIKYWNLRDIDFSGLAPASGDNDKNKPDGQVEASVRSLYTHQAHEKDINSISVAPNDKVFATGSQDKTAKIWNVDTGALVGVCKGHKRGVWCTKFSPVDQVLATSSSDKTVKIWSLKDFTCLKTFEGHTNSVLRVDFLTAGLQLVSAGSDGLVKLWTIKTNECVGTLDNHTEKVWALAIRKDEKFIASGGADSVVNFWEDVTLEEQEDELREKEEFIVKEQELKNFMHKKDYLNAILLALSLEQPFRLLGMFREVIESRPEGDESITGLALVDKVLGDLTGEPLEKLLLYIRDWNTNAKHSYVAQTVLHAILSLHSADDLVKIANAKELIDGLLPYTDRHYQRMDDLITQSFIIDYTLHAQE